MEPEVAACAFDPFHHEAAGRGLGASACAVLAENESRSAWFHGHERVAFVCECADPECRELLSLDRETYSAVRASPVRFVVAVDHHEGNLERVVEPHERYWIVEEVDNVDQGQG